MPPVLILILFRPGTGVLRIVVDEKKQGYRSSYAAMALKRVALSQDE